MIGLFNDKIPASFCQLIEESQAMPGRQADKGQSIFLFNIDPGYPLVYPGFDFVVHFLIKIINHLAIQRA